MYRVTQEQFPGGEYRARMYFDPQFRRAREEKEIVLNNPDSSAPPEGAGGGPSSLDISAEFAKSSKPPQRKLSGMTLEARRQLLRAGAVLDEEFVPEECLFLTGTIPGGGQAVFDAVASVAPSIVKWVKDWVAYYSPIRYDLYCWELQKRGAPHLHYVCVIPDPVARAECKARFKQEWCSIMERVSTMTGIDVFVRGFGERIRHTWDAVQAYAEECRSSAAGYLAKYLSKGKVRGLGVVISRWASISRPLREAIEKGTVRNDEGLFTYAEARRKMGQIADDLKPMANVVYEYPHKVGAGRSIVAYLSKPMSRLYKESKMSIPIDVLPDSRRERIQTCFAVQLFDELMQTYVEHERFFEERLSTEAFMNELRIARNMLFNNGTGKLRRYGAAIANVSALMTCERLKKYLSKEKFERHIGNVRAFFHVYDCPFIWIGEQWEVFDQASLLLANFSDSYYGWGRPVADIDIELAAEVVDEYAQMCLEMGI